MRVPGPFMFRMALSEVAPPYNVEIYETMPLGVIPTSPVRNEEMYLVLSV
jgi:hypothetical protein